MKNVEDVKKQFKEIANMLFQDFHIEKEGVRYDFLEVEFYFYNEKEKARCKRLSGLEGCPAAGFF